MLLFCFAVATPPKCYNPSDPTLRSTAWFHQYIGDFIPFITVADLQQFGGIKVRKAESNNPETHHSDVIRSWRMSVLLLQLEQFTTDPLNLELFAKNEVSPDVISAYANMLFTAKPDFSVKLWANMVPLAHYTANMTLLKYTNIQNVLNNRHI